MGVSDLLRLCAPDFYKTNKGDGCDRGEKPEPPCNPDTRKQVFRTGNVMECGHGRRPYARFERFASSRESQFMWRLEPAFSTGVARWEGSSLPWKG